MKLKFLLNLKRQKTPQKKGAAPAQAMDHIDEPTPGQGKKAADLGGAKPDAKVEKGGDEDRSEKAIGKKAA